LEQDLSGQICGELSGQSALNSWRFIVANKCKDSQNSSSSMNGDGVFKLAVDIQAQSELQVKKISWTMPA